MVVKVNEKSVAAEPMNVGLARQRLLTPERVDNVDVLLDRLTLAAGVSTRFEPSAKSLAWLHLLAGEAELETHYRERLSAAHSAFLPPEFPATISTHVAASLL